MTNNNTKPQISDELETRIIIIGPDSRLTPEIIAKKVLSFPITVKITCWGLILSGAPEVIHTAVREVRELDPHRIFTKLRGYPPGDPRICRFHRGGGARPGFHLIEFESSLLPHISRALESPQPSSSPTLETNPLSVKRLREIINETEE